MQNYRFSTGAKELLGFKMGVHGTTFNVWAEIELEKGWGKSIEIIGTWHDSPDTVNCTVYMLGGGISEIYVANPWVRNAPPPEEVIIPTVYIKSPSPWFAIRWDKEC